MKMEAVKTQTALIYLEEQGFIRYSMLPKAEITFDNAMEYINVQRGLTNEKKIPVLADIRSIKTVDRKARMYLIGKETLEVTSALALLIDSPVSKIIGNFFIGINKPQYQTKLFTSEKKAIEWLREFVI